MDRAKFELIGNVGKLEIKPINDGKKLAIISLATSEKWKTDKEELYNNISGKLHETAQPIAKGKQTYKSKAGKEMTDEAVVAWTNTYNGKTKVFATTLGHNNTTVGDDRYLDLVARGLLWSVGKLDEAHLKPAKKVMLDE